MKNLKLYNDVEIPCIGYGTWKTEKDTTAEVVCQAIQLGYRHIDTAAAYGNEDSVGEGIKRSNIARSELFVTSKLWNSEHSYDKAIAACNETLAKLQMDYLDLYLIHWPVIDKPWDEWVIDICETWRAMEDLYKAKKVRAIGLSNFLCHHLDVILKHCTIKPMVNQLEFHPGMMQKEIVEKCHQENILVEAWSPLGSGEMLSNEKLGAIAQKYNKSIAQLCIKWCLQNHTLPLPKSTNPQRIAQNIDVFDFEISDEDMDFINNMEYFAGSGFDPDTVVRK